MLHINLNEEVTLTKGKVSYYEKNVIRIIFSIRNGFIR